MRIALLQELLALGGEDCMMMMMMMMFLALKSEQWELGSVLHTREENGQTLDDIVGSFEENEPTIVRVAQSPHFVCWLFSLSLFIRPALATRL